MAVDGSDARLHGSSASSVRQYVSKKSCESIRLTDCPGGEPQNRFLDGPFAPVEQEVTAHQLEVFGKIPEELNGRYVWCGPNASPFDPEDPRTYNWFTGSGMLSGVRLREGRAEWYRNRFVRDELTTPHLGVPRLPGPSRCRAASRTAT
ncbi:carotenoid oxygenase family protein [Streptomyces sp. NPDC088921]|uniref:carotenoid oxygenase family protein n=1 Tax=unclassified Streptomyces TaxID=2593676 RepID=UPI00342280FD